MTKVSRDKTLSASDIFEQLHGTSSGASVVFTGLIDKSDHEQAILFSSGLDAPAWTKIPTLMINKVQFIRNVRIKENTYPLAHVFMKDPETEEGRVFASVAQLHQEIGPVTASVASAPSLATESFGCPGGRWVFDMATGKQFWYCPPTSA